MDIRDIAEYEKYQGDALVDIFRLQRELIEEYTKIEALPKPPIDVQSKASQTILKDFTSRVIEEIAEGDESYGRMIDTLEVDFNSWMITSDLDKSDSFVSFIQDLQNFNEECADALHFMVELLIYTNIEPKDIYNYVAKRVNPNFKKDFGGLISVINIKVMREYPICTRNILPFQQWMTKEEKDYCPARNVSTHHIEGKTVFQWNITKELMISRNCLKNKPWKQSGVLTDEQLYQEQLIKAFIGMIEYFVFMGLNESTLHYLYYKKNKVNKFRIKSNY